MKRAEVTEKILDDKRNKGLSFTGIAEELDAERGWATVALLGQHPLAEDQAQRLVELPDLSEEVIPILK